MKFRKKPVEVEAVQWQGWPHVIQGVEKHHTYPQCGWIHTLEGGHEVTKGDWIITGVVGEKYPCKPDIFEMTYEPVEL